MAGLALRMAFLHWRPEVSGDTLLYGEIAQNLLKHHLYGRTTATLHATYIRLPGYPVFLAMSFAVFGVGKYYPVLWLNVALDLATCCLIGALAGGLGGRRAGLVGLWLAALCPFTANYCAAALTETPSLFCVALAYFGLQRLTVRERLASTRAKIAWAAVIGMALSWAVLLRPEQGLLAAAVVPAMVWIGWRARANVPDRKAWLTALTPALLTCSIVLLPLVAWGVRNARVMGHFEPLAPKSATDPGEPVPNGFNHWYRTWGIDFKSTYDVYWNYDGAGLALSDLPPRAFDSSAQYANTAKLFKDYDKVQLQRADFDAEFERIAEQRDAAHPLRSHVLLPLARVANMWLRPRTELMDLPMDWWNWRAHTRGSAIAAGMALLNLGVLGLATAGIWMQRTRVDPIRASMLFFVALRTVLLLTLDNSEPRYTLECFPVLLVFAALVFAETHQQAASA